MSEIIPGPVVTVVTNKGTFQTKKLVITAGAWTKALCSKLGVQLPFEVIHRVVFIKLLYTHVRICSVGIEAMSMPM